jgi:hypothetical protein
VIAGGRPSRARWQTFDLERRLCGVLDFAQQCVERLAANGYSDAEEPANTIRPEKLIGETAIVLYAASAVGSDAVKTRIDAVARLLVPHARSPRILLGLCLEPSLALDYAEAHICLGALGHRDADVDALVRQSATAQAAGGRERVPHRVLEQHWIGAVWAESTAASRHPAPAAAAPSSILGKPMDVLGGGKSETYAFTHALMYVRDFNIRPQRLPRSRAAILAEAEAALAKCIDQEDYDLAGEVLMAWPLTGATWSAGAAFAFRVLARAEDKHGRLPAPGTRQQRLDKLQGDARTDYVLATAYHTVYVMGLLCAAALHPGRAPPARLPPRRGPDRSAADAVLRFLDDAADKQSPQWRHEFEAATPAEREALAGFLLTVALHRNIGRREFGAVHGLLKLGYTLGLADTPAASQAAEMLERLATFERMTGKSPGEIKPMPAEVDPSR